MKDINLRIPRFFFETILIISSFIVYFSCLKTGFFCWDDTTVALNPANRQFTIQNIIQLFTTPQAGLFHPVTSLSFMIDYYFGRGTPFMFHFTNLLLHSINTLLVYLFLKRLINNNIIAFFTALLWGIHPVHVESVVWITSRKDLLYSFFYILSLLFYLKCIKNGGSWKYYLVAILFFLLSLLSKVQAVTLPAILFLIDFYSRRRVSLKTFLDKVPFLILCVLFGFLNYMAQQQYGYTSYGHSFSGFEKIFLAVYAMSEYAIKIFIPYPLSIFYPYPFKPGTLPHIKEIMSVTAFMLLLIACMAFRKKVSNVIWFGILFFLTNAAIVALTSLNRESVMADRYAYLSSVGILLIIPSLQDRIRGRASYKKYLNLILLIYTGLLSIVTFQRTLLWQDQDKLFKNALSHYDQSEIILNTLGTLEIENGNFREARVHLDKAIVLSPDYAQAYYNRGILNRKADSLDSAILDFTTAININEGYTDAFYARGITYMKINELLLADRDYSSVLRNNPNHFGALLNRAIVRGELGDFNKALQDLNSAIQVDSTVPSAYYLRGIALFEVGLNGCNDLQKADKMGYPKSKEALLYYCR
jgi:protein O-mannosyl-transferase